MNIIASADKNWAIGNKNKLLVRIPADMRMFRELTTNHCIIMGRKTLETFPGGKPLKDRKNIVITKQKDLSIPDAYVVHSVEEALETVKGEPKEHVFIVGGASIYSQFLPFCDTAYITKINYAYEADAHIPDLDQDQDWILKEESEEQTYYDLEYKYLVYKKRETV